MALAATRDIRLICFDLDGTLIDNTIYIWSTLHEHFGSDASRRAKAAEDYRAGKTSYREWFLTDLELLRGCGADRAGMLEAFERLVPAPGAHETLAELGRRGYRLGLISGSLDLVLDHFFPRAPFAHVLINKIEFDSQGRISGGQHTAYDLGAKAAGLAEIAGREGISLAECAFVGDNVNDLEVMQAAGFSLGVNIKNERVAEAADVVVAGNDLRKVLEYFPGPVPS